MERSEFHAGQSSHFLGKNISWIVSREFRWRHLAPSSLLDGHGIMMDSARHRSSSFPSHLLGRVGCNVSSVGAIRNGMVVQVLRALDPDLRACATAPTVHGRTCSRSCTPIYNPRIFCAHGAKASYLACLPCAASHKIYSCSRPTSRHIFYAPLYRLTYSEIMTALLCAYWIKTCHQKVFCVF
jgi:hypothetical protein